MLVHPSFALVLLAVLPAALAERVSVPLHIGLPYLSDQVAHALDMDDSGHAELRHDGCSAVYLSDLSLSRQDQDLQLSLAVTAEGGTEAFGRCVGFQPWNGIMMVQLSLAPEPDGAAVALLPQTAELRRPNGSSGLLTRPARALAENLVLPRLGTIRIDLHQPLAQLDQLIAGLLPNPGVSDTLVERVRLDEIGLTDDALRLSLAFEAEPPQPPVDTMPEQPLSVPEQRQWETLEDELDGVLTAVILELAQQANEPDLRLDLLGVLADSRLAIAAALMEPQQGTTDPVRDLFLRSWARLRPHAAALARTAAYDSADSLRLAAFISAADAIDAIDALGADYGVEISRDGLRRLARMLLSEGAPASFTPLPLGVDARLRSLFPFNSQLGEPQADVSGRGWMNWLLPAAVAEDIDPAEALRALVPKGAGLQAYLALVHRLLDEEAQRHLAENERIAAEHRALIDPMVRATAWKESCWRHYLDGGDPPEVISSSIGSVGLMQINQRVWRGVYDVELLQQDVRYNTIAGIEILTHYLIDYAIRRGEHEQTGGVDNLVRATYAAYNGGPGQMARYRKADTPTRLKAIDAAFWQHYEEMQQEDWPAVSSCYGG